MFKIETERLFLREMTPQDFDALSDVLCDAENMKFAPHLFDAPQVKNWIARNERRYRVFGFGLWAVCQKESGKVIGDCGLTMQNVNGTILPEIGYHIAREYQRRGYGKEAARGALDWTFCHTPFLQICSYMRKENIASAATAAANDMRLCEEFIDNRGFPTLVFTITRAKWQALGREKQTKSSQHTKERN